MFLFCALTVGGLLMTCGANVSVDDDWRRGLCQGALVLSGCALIILAAVACALLFMATNLGLDSIG